MKVQLMCSFNANNMSSTTAAEEHVYIVLTYPLLHKRYVTVGLFEERNHIVFVSLSSSCASTISNDRQRILFNFTDWNLLTLLHESVNNGLKLRFQAWNCRFNSRRRGRRLNKVPYTLKAQRTNLSWWMTTSGIVWVNSFQLLIIICAFFYEEEDLKTTSTL